MRFSQGFYVYVMVGVIFLLPALALAATDRETYELRGSVKKVIEESGTWTEGSTNFVHTSFYDRSGNLTEYRQESYKVGSKRHEETLRTIFERDAEGKITGTRSLGGENDLRQKRRYAYDEKGNQVEEAFYDKDGNLLFKFIYAFDDQGNRTETRTYLSDGSLKSKSIYKYDSKGNITTMYSYKECASDKVCKLEYTAENTYDKKGNRAEALIYKADGTLNERRVYTYNANGYEQEEVVYKSDGSISEKKTSSYEYDSTGNWIKRTTKQAVFRKGKLVQEPPHITKRVITYYK